MSLNLNNLLKTPSNECSYVFIDLETSGKYPISSEICEIAALKWENGSFTEEFSTLIKPKKTMSQQVINIHKITNEMVKDAPCIESKITELREFIGSSVCVAHHAPFDLGFLAYDFEMNNIQLPQAPVICTSLLARAKVHNIINHKLQSLVKHFHIEGGQAHRALDDAKACASVYFNCLNTFELETALNDITIAQGEFICWQSYSYIQLKNLPALNSLIHAVEQDKKVSLCYDGGSKPGQFRDVIPISVVRNPEGDFLVADDMKSKKLKRYYLSKVKDCQII